MSDNRLRRVVVTGLGLVTPLGRTLSEVWSRWAAGRSAAAAVTKFDARSLPIRIACEVNDFNPRLEVCNRKMLRLMVGGEDFGFKAAADALTHSGVAAAIERGEVDPTRCGLAIGCHKEGFRHAHLHEAFELARREDGAIDRQRFLAEGWARIPPQIIIEALPNIGLYYIAHEFGLLGANVNLLSVGVGGLQALSEGMHAVAEGDADVMVAGSFDSWVNWMCLGHNHFTGYLSTSAAPPESVARPFDVRRTGGVAGEGAAMFVLEEWNHARARGAQILGELLGSGSAAGIPGSDDRASVDALARCITSALESAECGPQEIDLVQLHGDATPRGDWIESRGLQAALGRRASEIPCTTIKSASGLMGAASGPLEAALALEALQRGSVLPIVNLTEPDEELELRLVREPEAGLNLRRALVIQRAWPSLYAVLVVGRAPDV